MQMTWPWLHTLQTPRPWVLVFYLTRYQQEVNTLVQNFTERSLQLNISETQGAVLWVHREKLSGPAPTAQHSQSAAGAGTELYISVDRHGHLPVLWTTC